MDAALKRGAAGFISKTADGPTLINAALRLLFGEQVLIADETQMQDRRALARDMGITPRQLEILDLLAEGLPNKVICQRLSRSEEHTSELQSRPHLVCRLLLEKKKQSQYE